MMVRWFGMTVVWLWRVVLVVAVCAVVGGLAWVNAEMDGQLTSTYSFDHYSPYLTPPFPNGRFGPVVTEAQESWRPITAEPVYFDVWPPQSFEQATVVVEYRNHGQPLIQLGAFTDEQKWFYDLATLEFSLLESLRLNPLEWHYLYEDGISLWQQTPPAYPSIEAFRRQPFTATVGMYNYQQPQRLVIPDYTPQPSRTVIDKSLRGYHRLVTYIKNEPLDWNILYQDVNRHTGPDPVVVTVSDSAGRRVWQTQLADDGVGLASGQHTDVRTIAIHLESLPEGVYTVDWQANDDIIIRQLDLAQDKLLFSRRLYLGDNVNYSGGALEQRLATTTLYTTGRKLTASTSHNEGLQALGLNDSEWLISYKHQQHTVFTPAQPTTVTVPVNDVTLESDGVWYFNPSHYFSIEATAINEQTAIGHEGLSAVIAGYTPPLELADGWRQATATFALGRLQLSDGERLRFILSIPGYGQGNRAEVDLRRLTVVLSKSPLSLNQLWPRLTSLFWSSAK